MLDSPSGSAYEEFGVMPCLGAGPGKRKRVRTSEGTAREFSAVGDDEWELHAAVEGHGTLEGLGTWVGSLGQAGCREGSPQWKS